MHSSTTGISKLYLTDNKLQQVCGRKTFLQEFKRKCRVGSAKFQKQGALMYIKGLKMYNLSTFLHEYLSPAASKALDIGNSKISFPVVPLQFMSGLLPVK